jgi:hypothetical protein
MPWDSVYVNVKKHTKNLNIYFVVTFVGKIVDLNNCLIILCILNRQCSWKPGPNR